MTRSFWRLVGLTFIAAVAVAVLTLWLVKSVTGTHGAGHSAGIVHERANIEATAFARPQPYPCPIEGDFKPVDVSVGLLCDYYEHGIEHAPPRDPSGVMQKREHYYAAPHDPFEFRNADAGLASELARLSSRWKAGDSFGDMDCQTIQEFAQKSSVASDVLIEAGRAMDWLAGDAVAGALLQAGLAKAQGEYSGVSPGDPAALPLLHAMEQTKALWRMKAWPALEIRFRLANSLSISMSAEQRRAHYLLADVLYSECKYDEAVRQVEQTAAEDERAGDLGVLEASDIPEMLWTRALFMIANGQLERAITLFDSCAKYEGPHQYDSRRLAILATIRSDNLDEAVQRVKRLPRPVPIDALTDSIRIELAARMERRFRD